MTNTTTKLQRHIELTARHDSLAWEADAETVGGLVSTTAIDGGEARAIAESLEESGYTVSTAPDADDRGKRWIYCVPPANE